MLKHYVTLVLQKERKNKERDKGKYKITDKKGS
jgi:hypothetical protein